MTALIQDCPIMYETYWQLKQRPFENGADPRFYYPGESHQAALLKLRYAIENHRGGALLAGPSGVGKTLLTTMLSGILGEAFAPMVHLVFPQMSTAELLAYLADELEGAEPTAETPGVQVSIRRIQNLLAANNKQTRHAVVVIDEAHLVQSVHTFEALRLLLNFETNGVPALTLLLVGEPGILPMLDRMPQWEERLAVKCLLRPFSEAETAAYVEHRLRAAGAVRRIFDPDAMPTIYALTHGIARRINRLCDLTLLIGFAEERQTLGAQQFEAVCHELVAVAPD
jgi:general secretion pathway protein A